LRSKDGSIRGSIKLIENIKAKRKNKKGKGSDSADWTWSEISSLVKYSKVSYSLFWTLKILHNYSKNLSQIVLGKFQI
jgi:hypothetical protein